MSEEQKEKQLIALREKRQVLSDELLQLQKDKNSAQKKVDRTVYKDDVSDHEVKDKIKLIKMRNKRTQ